MCIRHSFNCLVRFCNDALQSNLVINTVTTGITKWRKGIIPTHSIHSEAVKVNKESNDIQKMITRNTSFIFLMFDVYEATST